MVYLILTCFVIFAILILSYHFYGERALITIGIGSAIGANFYNIRLFPFIVFGFNSGIDICLFSLFVFCIALSLIIHGRKSAINLLITVICAIIFTAILEFLAIISSTGLFEKAALNFVSFIVFVFAIFVSGMVSIFVFEKLKNSLPIIVNITIFIILSNFIKTVIDIIYLTILKDNINIIGSIIGISTALIFSIITYIIIKKYPYKEKIQIVHTIK